MPCLKPFAVLLAVLCMAIAHGDEALPLLQRDALHSTPESIVDAYVEYRDGVYKLNPPVEHMEPSGSVEDAEGETWFEKAWARWMSLPHWFMAHSAGPGIIDPALQGRLWPEGHTGDIVIWEHPGQQLIHFGLADPETGIPDILASFPAPDWETREGESAEAFAQRERSTRRVVWKFRSPHREPEPEPLPRMMMAMGGGPPQFRVLLDHADPEIFLGRVEFGLETLPGPFTVWRHDSGIPNGWETLPGNWFPVLWERDRGTESERDFTVDSTGAGEEHPLFLRATLGMVDSDNGGIGDGMDDGWELWHFGELVSPTGDEDSDGLSNLEEYLHGTDPNSPDTDGDGLSDGDEILLGRDPLKRDHPDVDLQVTISY